ncbi:SMC-Scp complex subunit ScpB [Spirochaeta cellobiosiphila]|uniref:SMC-Scp complex subunit ScpB n=1 Tax=Spirochaeta cellobiosiphila TaxID=504483 RepID=UPI00048B5734|nr:SMC-Scp complex subunit ScpB [Spirochaeta cellobiosiphila]
MQLEKETALVEAILFLENEPIDERNIAKIAGIPKEAVVSVLQQLKNIYKDSSHGLEIVEIAGGYTFAPKSDLLNYLKDHYGKKNDDKLSKAAMETLSIIAYSQPITRAEIESIRGVSSGNMIRMLMGKNFVKEVGKKDVPGKPVQYGTTKDFLKSFKLNSIADLPKLDELEMKKFELDPK